MDRIAAKDSVVATDAPIHGFRGPLVLGAVLDGSNAGARALFVGTLGAHTGQDGGGGAGVDHRSRCFMFDARVTQENHTGEGGQAERQENDGARLARRRSVCHRRRHLRYVDVEVGGCGRAKLCTAVTRARFDSPPSCSNLGRQNRQVSSKVSSSPCAP
jgi:hypothetical protein